MKKLLFTLLVLLMVADMSYSQGTWTFVSTLPAPSPAINSISVVSQNIIWVCCAASGGAARVYRSVNGGTTWQLKNTGLPSSANGYGISALDSLTCWVGNDVMSIWRTTDGGSSWTNQLTVSGSFTDGIKMFDANTGWIYADPTAVSGQPYQLRYTTNGGTTWTQNATAPVSSTEYGIINAWDWTSQTNIWFGSANTTPNSSFAKVYRSTTGFSGTFTPTSVTGTGGSQGCYYQAVGFINATSGLVGSSGSNLKKTTDGGVTYVAVANPPGYTSFAAMNMCSLKDGSGTIRAALDSGGTAVIWRTTNLGTSWVKENVPLQMSANTISHMQFLNANLGFASTGSSAGGVGSLGKYYNPTGIIGNNGNSPVSFKLKQNFPNPFNPGTTIEFDLPKADFVTIKVYNSVGREVATLVSERMYAGTYQVFFDASSLSSGLYFYKIITDNFTDTKKMLLVK